MSDPVRQHWVPKVYLRQFAIGGDSQSNDPQVYMYDLHEGKQHTPSISNVTVKKHLYTITHNREKDFHVETQLADLESRVRPQLLALSNGENVLGQDEHRKLIASFLATLFMRNKTAIRFHEGLRTELIGNAKEKPGSSTVFTSLGENQYEFPSQIWEQFQNLDDSGKKNLFSSSILKTAQPVANVIKELKWVLLAAEDGNFITSDIPLVVYHPGEERWGIGTKGTHIHIAISPKCVLLLGTDLSLQANKKHSVSREAVDSLNGLTMTQADRQLISSIGFEHMRKTIADFRAEYNRVRAGFSPALPTTPCMRVRTGRFIKVTGP